MRVVRAQVFASVSGRSCASTVVNHTHRTWRCRYLAHHELTCVPTMDDIHGSDESGGEGGGGSPRDDAQPAASARGMGEKKMTKQEMKAAASLAKRDREQARTMEACAICGRR